MTNLDRIYNNIGSTSPINQQLNQVTQARNLMQTINNSHNPMAFIQNMAVNNPAVQQALALVNQNGNNPQQAAINYARQNGIDVNSLLQAFGKR